MASKVKVNGTWKTTSTVYTKVNGTWKTVANAYTKVNGTWKQWLAPAPSYYAAPVYYAAGGGGGGSYPNIGSVIAYGAGAGQAWTADQAYITWGGSGWGSYTVIASNGSSSNSASAAGGPPVLLSGFSAGTTYSVTVTLYANASYTGTSASSSTSFTTAGSSSGGGGTTYYTVPNVVGLTPSAASAQITGSGNYYGGSVGTLTTNTLSKDGTVAAQYPSSGTYTSPQTVTISTYAYSAPTAATFQYSTTYDGTCTTIAACPSGYENIRADHYSDGSIQYVGYCCTPAVSYYSPPVVTYYAAPIYYAPNTSVTYYAAPIYYTAPPVVTYYAAPITYYSPPVVTYYAAPIYYAPNTSVTYYAAPVYYSSGGGGGGGCWLYGTQVTMADGSFKKIEELNIGDKVRTAVIPTYPNGEDSSLWYPASAWSSDNDEDITYEITTVTNTKHVIENLYYELNDTYKVTGDHFLYVRKDGVWQFAKVEELRVGDYLHDENGPVEITKKKTMLTQAMVVDIDVEPNDLFLANGIITHNFKGYSFM
jgi:hypothetical protein